MANGFHRRGLKLVAALGVTLVCGPATAAAAPRPSPAIEVPAVAYQLNAGHTGVTANPVTQSAAGPTKLWSNNLGGAISYPLIVGQYVYVTVANSGGSGTKLYALDALSGDVAWGPVDLGGNYNWSGLAYDNSRIFAVNAGGLMQAFGAYGGQPLWSVQLPDQSMFTSPPTASHGFVYTGGAGSGGTVYALNEATGAIAWTAAVENGDNSSPAVDNGGVYVSYACGQTYDFFAASGALHWHRSTACEGGGGKTPVVADGRLFVRDFSYPAVLKEFSGTVMGAFSASGPAPAVDSDRSYDLNGSTLAGVNLSTESQLWSFAGDGTLDSAPLEAGGIVMIGGSSGELYGLSATTGRVAWSVNVGSGIPAPDEQNVSSPLTGLATSAGLIVVPAGDVLVALK